jgi:hypothetical protein
LISTKKKPTLEPLPAPEEPVLEQV